MTPPTLAAETELREAVRATRAGLADTLATLSPAQWDAPTLCAGWRVREVVAHITMPFRYPAARFAFELLKARGNFSRMADRVARRDATMPAADLLAALRDNVAHPWKPPGGGYEGALVHDVIHGLDITEPLELDARLPEDRLRIVLSALTRSTTLGYFGADLRGVELRADDMKWSFGEGTAVTGPARDLALVLCGRTLPSGRLQGALRTRFVEG